MLKISLQGPAFSVHEHMGSEGRVYPTSSAVLKAIRHQFPWALPKAHLHSFCELTEA